MYNEPHMHDDHTLLTSAQENRMMPDNPENLTAQSTLSKAVAVVAIELNIARRNWSAYPPGHQIVETSVQKLLAAWHKLLLLQSPLQIGVTRDELLLEEGVVEKGNMACRMVATAFFERGIGALLLRQEPSREDLLSLLRLMTMKRENILAEGGIEKLWEDASITFMKVRGIRYDRFSGTEEAVITATGNDLDSAGPDNVWERFVRI